MKDVGILLLAAGGSSRMGSPKQLLPWRGSTLLRHMAEVACLLNTGPVLVVLGHAAQECRAVIEDLPLQITANSEWEQGMGTSIAVGTKALLQTSPDLTAIMVMLCDQVAVDRKVLLRLLQAHADTTADVVMSQYAEAHGPPALFARSMFKKLIQLKGQQGAKKLWEETKRRTSIAFPEGIQDIDTTDDYIRCRNLS